MYESSRCYVKMLRSREFGFTENFVIKTKPFLRILNFLILSILSSAKVIILYFEFISNGIIQPCMMRRRLQQHWWCILADVFFMQDAWLAARRILTHPFQNFNFFILNNLLHPYFIFYWWINVSFLRKLKNK